MTKLLASLAFLVLAGCGSSTPPVTTPDAAPDVLVADVFTPDVFVDPVIGTWIDQIDTNSLIRFKFDGTNFEMDVLEVLTDGTYGMRIDQGTYSLTASSINARVKSSSCQGVIAFAGNSATWSYTKSGNSLSVNTGTTYLVCQLATNPPTGMGIAAIGCFKADGTFVAHAASPVP